MGKRRVMIVGIDCASPKLAFDRYANDMPTLSALRKKGLWGPLKTCVPPITVPAWVCMASGQDPGELGIYGFRKHIPGRYDLSLYSSHDMNATCLWEQAAQSGHKAAALFVPLTYPPKPYGGMCVSGCLTPDAESAFTWPPDLKAELEKTFGSYRIDVEEHRSGNTQSLIESLYAMTEQHFSIAIKLWTQHQLDFLMMVDIGTDRLHHAFWQHADPEHPEHDPNHPQVDTCRAYYRFLDTQLRNVLDVMDESTTLMVVSDHGAKPMLGGFCINDWLIQEGYLVLEHPADRPQRLEHDSIDWPKTTAWAEGGYYGRLFINKEGREAHGSVSEAECVRLQEDIANKLCMLTLPNNQRIQTQCLRAPDIYRQVQGAPPDLMLFFNDLSLRAIGSVGNSELVVSSSDQGFDSCNHDWNGMLVMAGSGVPADGYIHDASIYDIAPTVRSLMDLPLENLVFQDAQSASCRDARPSSVVSPTASVHRRPHGRDLLRRS